MANTITSLPFPAVIDIENVRGLCNARCPMCDIETDKVKPGSVMNNQTFEQIIRRFLPYAEQLKQINLVGMGESLIDKEICTKIRMSKQLLPSTHIALVTNAALLTPQIATDLLNAGIDEVIVSIDSIHKEVYESIRVKLTFEKTLENVLQFINLRDRGDYAAKVLVRMIEQEANQNEWNEYVGYWQEHLNSKKGDMILKFPIHKYPDNETEVETSHVVCAYVFSRMSITADGRIQLCCVDDGASFYPLGNILNQDPKEVFNGEVFTMVRQAMNDNRWEDLPYCVRCNVPLQREKRFGVAV